MICGTWQGNLADHKGPKNKSKQMIWEDGMSKQEKKKKKKVEKAKVKENKRRRRSRRRRRKR